MTANFYCSYVLDIILKVLNASSHVILCHMHKQSNTHMCDIHMQFTYEAGILYTRDN